MASVNVQHEKTESGRLAVVNVNGREYRVSVCAGFTTVYAMYAARNHFGRTFFPEEKYQNAESTIPTAYKRDGAILLEVVKELRSKL